LLQRSSDADQHDEESLESRRSQQSNKQLMLLLLLLLLLRSDAAVGAKLCGPIIVNWAAFSCCTAAMLRHVL